MNGILAHLEKTAYFGLQNKVFRLHAVNVLTLWCSSCAGQKRPHFLLQWNECTIF